MNESPIQLTLITATRNRREHLARCIESVAAQDYPHKQHVIIDGASDDGTVGLLRERAEVYPHICWISEPDTSLSQAFNKGLARATGDWVNVLGDDDLILSGAMSRIAGEAAAHPEAGLLVGGCDYINETGEIFFHQEPRFSSRFDLVECWDHWGREVSIPAPSTWISARALADVGGFRECDQRAMDYRHWIELTRDFEVQIVPQTLARFRVAPDSISGGQHAKQWAETLRISRDYWGEFGTSGRLRLAASFLNYQSRHFARRVRNRLIRR